MAKNNTSIWITTDLILRNTKYADDEIVTILSGESIDLIEAVAAVAREVHVYDSSFTLLKRLQRYVKAKNVVFLQSVYPPDDAGYSTALVLVPKGRELARAQLWTAMQALKPGGDLYIAGPNDGGAKSVIKDAVGVFGTCQVIDYKKSHRIALTIKQGPYPFPADWQPVQPQLCQFDTPIGSIEVATMPGIFSWDTLDDGTRLLLEHLSLDGVTSVLDIGCGNGIIGVLAARTAPSVTLVDDNLIALNCARATIEYNHLINAVVVAGDGYSELAGQKFDLIVCNPPFHKKWDVSANTANRIISETPQYLNRGGRLLLVANAFLKYESVMSAHFKQSRVVVETSQYKVLEGVL